jgi:Phage terminase, small subunit
MARPGRKSRAALELVPSITAIDPGSTRIRPRDEAPETVAQIIRDLVANVAPDHFRKTDWPLLESYARAILLEQRAHRMLDDEGPVSEAGKTNPWLAVMEKSGRLIIACSMRLRLSPQSRMEPRSAGKQVRAPRCWMLTHDLRSRRRYRLRSRGPRRVPPADRSEAMGDEPARRGHARVSLQLGNAMRMQTWSAARKMRCELQKAAREMSTRPGNAIASAMPLCRQ